MNKLGFYRQKTGASQKDIALLAGISAPMINQIEQFRKTPSLKTAQRIVIALKAKGVDCGIDDVFPIPQELDKAS